MTLLYHITDLDNLPGILGTGGLRCKYSLQQGGTAHVDIAYGHIQDRRAQTPVPCGPGGSLHEYVPFYFSPRSPMLFAIARGYVPGYSGTQYKILHLVTAVEDVVAESLQFVFSDGHAVMAMSDFFTDVSELSRIDWPLMSARYWHDTDEDGDRKRRRQAEFLIHLFVPWRLVQTIGVMNEPVARRVKTTLAGNGHRPVVSVKREWYY